MKKFNITGLCYPDDCFMVDTSDKIEKILDLIYQKNYFVINRPPQYGKTTTMTLLEMRLLETVFIYNSTPSRSDLYKSVEYETPTPIFLIMEI